MFGNTQGWILAGVVLLAEAGAVSYALSFDATSPPTAVTTTAGALEAIVLPIDPRSILPIDQAGDAGAFYRTATASYLSGPAVYENFLKYKERGDIPKLAALEMLVNATRLRDGVIFTGEPEAVVVYGKSTSIQAIRAVGLCATTAGFLLEKRQPARARLLYESAFSLGARLFDERLTYEEVSAGIELMSTAGASLAALQKAAGQADEAARLVKFTDAQRDYVRDVLLPRFEACQHNGDVFAFAREADKERMWRVEAILKLGRMKYNVGDPGSPGDQREAARLALRFAEADADPVVKRAGMLARDLTVEQFRTLH